jgi:hypothetical protein
VSTAISTRDRQWVAARRATVRALHPDRGGDPDAFITALAAIDTTYGHPSGGGHDDPLIVIVHHPRWRRLVAVISRAVRHIPGTGHHYAHL